MNILSHLTGIGWSLHVFMNSAVWCGHPVLRVRWYSIGELEVDVMQSLTSGKLTEKATESGDIPGAIGQVTIGLITKSCGIAAEDVTANGMQVRIRFSTEVSAGISVIFREIRTGTDLGWSLEISVGMID